MKPYQELICGVPYRVRIVLNRKLGKTITVTLQYCGGSNYTDYGQFGGIWCTMEPDHRKRKVFQWLNVMGVELLKKGD